VSRPINLTISTVPILALLPAVFEKLQVALVDNRSPIYKSGLVFNSILYDENASCHIALGKGYPTCLKNGMSLNTEEALRKEGCNTSLVHTDFMIGADDLSVQGIDANGKTIQIIDAGMFVI
jgi:aminopeptidase